MGAVKGTQAILIVTAEGIILAADSRLNLSNGGRLDGFRKIVTLPSAPNLALVAAGTTKWLPEDVQVYTGAEPAALDIKRLAAEFAGRDRTAIIDEGYLTSLGGHIATSLIGYFTKNPTRWFNWTEQLSDGTPHPGWCKIMLGQQLAVSNIATVRVMRGDRYPLVIHDFKFSQNTYRLGAVQYITNGALPQEAAAPMLGGLFRMVPGIATEPLTAEAAAAVARAFIERVAQVSPGVGGRIDAILISGHQQPRDL